MVKITANEKDYLISKGCKWGEEVHRTFSNKKTYYLTESPRLLKMLDNYRKKTIVESH